MSKLHAVFLLSAAAGAGFAAWSLLGNASSGHEAGFDDSELEIATEGDDELGEIEAEGWSEAADPQREVTAVPAKAPAKGARPMLVLEGRVVDVSGAAVPGAAVRLGMRRSLASLARNRGLREVFRSGGRRGLRDQFRLRRLGKTVKTDARGRYRFRGPAYNETWLELTVTHGGFAPSVSSLEWESKQGKLHAKDVVLERGATLLGVVTDAAGAPLAGATVTWKPDGEPRARGRSRGRNGSRFGRRTTERSLEKLTGDVKTDAAGGFELAQLPKGRCHLVVELKRFLPGLSKIVTLEPEARIDAGRIALELGATLSGIVRDASGHPIARAAVRADVDGGSLRELFAGARTGRRGRGGARPPRPDEQARARVALLMRRKVEAKTDPKGVFVLEGLPHFKVDVRVERKGFIPDKKDAVDTKATQRVEFTLYRTLTVKGVILDGSTGKPITRYGIAARRIDAEAREGRRSRFGQLFGDRGAEMSRAFGRRGRARRSNGRTDPTQSRRRSRELSPEQQARQAKRDIERQSRDAERKSRRAAVEVFKKQRLGESGVAPRRKPRVVSHEDGAFVIDGLDAGRYVFDVVAPGFAHTAAGPLELKRGDAVPDVTFALPRGLVLSGVVLDKRSGEPIKNARLTLSIPRPEAAARNGERTRPRRGRGMRSMRGSGGDQGMRVADARADAKGQFVFVEQRPGEYELRVEAMDHLDYLEDRVTLAAARALELRVARGARVFGSVTGAQPGQRIALQFSSVDGKDVRTARANREGEYEIKGLQPGGWRVRVVDPQSARSRVGRIGGGRGRFGRGGPGGSRRAPQATPEGPPDLFVREYGEHRFNVDANRRLYAVVTGSVFKNGSPAKGLEVRLQAKQQPATLGPPRGGRGGRGGPGLSGRTDAKGAFRIKSVPAGRYVLEVRGARGRRGRGVVHREEIALAEGATWTRQFDLSVGELSFHVVDAKTGKPVERAMVGLVLAGEAGDKKTSEWRRLPSFRAAPVRNGKGKAEDLGLGAYKYVLMGRGLKAEPGSAVVGRSPGGTVELSVVVEPPKPGATKRSKQAGTKKPNRRNKRRRR